MSHKTTIFIPFVRDLGSTYPTCHGNDTDKQESSIKTSKRHRIITHKSKVDTTSDTSNYEQYMSLRGLDYDADSDDDVFVNQWKDSWYDEIKHDTTKITNNSAKQKKHNKRSHDHTTHTISHSTTTKRRAPKRHAQPHDLTDTHKIVNGVNMDRSVSSKDGTICSSGTQLDKQEHTHQINKKQDIHSIQFTLDDFETIISTIELVSYIQQRRLSQIHTLNKTEMNIHQVVQSTWDIFDRIMHLKVQNASQKGSKHKKQKEKVSKMSHKALKRTNTIPESCQNAMKSSTQSYNTLTKTTTNTWNDLAKFSSALGSYILNSKNSTVNFLLDGLFSKHDSKQQSILNKKSTIPNPPNNHEIHVQDLQDLYTSIYDRYSNNTTNRDTYTNRGHTTNRGHNAIQPQKDNKYNLHSLMDSKQKKITPSLTINTNKSTDSSFVSNTDDLTDSTTINKSWVISQQIFQQVVQMILSLKLSQISFHENETILSSRFIVSLYQHWYRKRMEINEAPLLLACHSTSTTNIDSIQLDAMIQNPQENLLTNRIVSFLNSIESFDTFNTSYSSVPLAYLMAAELAEIRFIRNDIEYVRTLVDLASKRERFKSDIINIKCKMMSQALKDSHVNWSELATGLFSAFRSPPESKTHIKAIQSTEHYSNNLLAHAHHVYQSYLVKPPTSNIRGYSDKTSMQQSDKDNNPTKKNTKGNLLRNGRANGKDKKIQVGQSNKNTKSKKEAKSKQINSVSKKCKQNKSSVNRPTNGKKNISKSIPRRTQAPIIVSGGRKWTDEEDKEFKEGMCLFGIGHWAEIISWAKGTLATRTSTQLYKRYKRTQGKEKKGK